MSLWRTIIGIAMALLVTWGVLVLFLVLARPKGSLLREAVRLLPDTLRLLRRLATDRTLPRGVRVRLWLLFVYLALPVDIIRGHFRAQRALIARLLVELQGRKAERRKLHVRVFVERPNMRADPANLLDGVLDAVKVATKLDDCWYSGSWDWALAPAGSPGSIRVEVWQGRLEVPLGAA